jgi:RNA polymerase sigma factor (sigma-70 family)
MRYHHQHTFVEGVHAERLSRAARRRPADLEGVVRAAADGDGAAWRSLVERFAAHIRTIARTHRLSAHDADDVAQTTWLRLLENIAGMRQPAAVAGWLTTTARREALSTIKSSGRERPAGDALLADEASDPVDAGRLTAGERRAAVEQAITALPPRDRALLDLLFADAAPSYTRISATLGMPVGSIGPTRQRCIARLRDDPRLRAVADD